MQASYALALAAASLAAGQVAGAQTIFNPAPSRIFGQAVLQQTGLLTAIAPNLVQGRELNAPQGLAIDSSSSPPILYVVDTGNNRILAWKNAFAFSKGDMADLVIGQRDFLSTAPQGPSGDLSTGFNQPVAAATDKSGNLYVVDAGNNRILRYPQPFAQTGALLTVDLILGQKDLNGRAPNTGQPQPAANTFAFTTGAGVFRSGLALDASGNLWVSDPGNNRVLRIPSNSLGTGAINQPLADLVLGQPDFVTNSLPQTIDRTKKNYLLSPSGLAFDPQGRLFVADGANRVVVYAPPFAIAQAAARVMGVVIAASGQTAATTSASTLGALTANNQALPPEGVVFIGSNPYVVDTGNARILGYAPTTSGRPRALRFRPPQGR